MCDILANFHACHAEMLECITYTRDLIYDLSAKLLVPTVSNYLGSPHINYSLALIWKSFVA